MARGNGTVGTGTDVGQHRSENQDNFAVREHPEATLLVLADGMGGHRGGSLASQLAVDAIVREVESSAIQWNDPHQIRSLLEQALFAANTEVHRAARDNAEAYNMGTTAVIVAVVDDEAHIAHVGDSRLYLIRGNQAKRLTTDHTAAQLLVETGQISAEEAIGHRESHRLMRAIGILPQVDPDVRPEPQKLHQFDTLLLCSDGLYDEVEGREMALAIQKFGPQEGIVKLIELANQRGGPDNITIVTYRRDDADGLLRRAREFLTTEFHGVPVYLWGVAAGALVIAATLLGLALT
jgi:serine/threonine protein phosphatase PrpC